MKMRDRWVFDGFFCLCSVVLGGGIHSAEPADGKMLFEKDWQWNDSAKPLREIDLQDTTLVRRRMRVQRTVNGVANADPRLIGVDLNALGVDPNEVAGDGLGPLHNAASCKDCHAGGGGSGVEHNVTLITVDPRSEFFKEIDSHSTREVMGLFPGLLASAGGLSFNTVVHDASTRPGYKKIRNGLSKHVPGEIDQAWFNPKRRTAEAISKQPVVAGRYKSIDYYLSQRNSPALFGLGAIRSISAQRMRAVASKQATLTAGEISGRVAGKFGWRGQVQTLQQFVSGACAGELGLNQGPAATQANDPADPEYVSPLLDISLSDVGQLTAFVASLPRPIEEYTGGHTRKYIRSGEKIFNSIGCAICHVPDLRPVSGLFSDLLLHDMGSELQAPFPAPVGDLRVVGMVDPVRFSQQPFVSAALAAGYYGSVSQTRPPLPYPFPTPIEPQFPRGELSDAEINGVAAATWDAMQREWKTPPLWGVADTAPYMHDGRAGTLDQAITWHGGEAAKVRSKYERLDQQQKDKLLAFLSSLRAPTIEAPAN